VSVSLRYDFGKNWQEFAARHLGEDTIRQSQDRIAEFLRVSSLEGLSFLDIGCGSGLHSLAAHRLGAASVTSFDYDPNSVQAAEQVRRYGGSPDGWRVTQGSVLDAAFMQELAPADIVYSWGVLHHTGDMWNAVRNAAIPLKADGALYIALYSSEIYVDPPAEYWLEVKRKYNAKGPIGRRLVEWWHVFRFHLMPALKAGRNPLQVIRDYGDRGMMLMTDVRDWLGGYPMDFAGLRETRDFCRAELGLDLVNVKAGQGCTEFLFCRPGAERWQAIEKTRTLVPVRGPFRHLLDLCYAFDIPELADRSDDESDPHRSRLMLYEDGVPLGFAHSEIYEVHTHGRGRFLHQGGSVYFSASDNSDPTKNGRAYAYCAPY